MFEKSIRHQPVWTPKVTDLLEVVSGIDPKQIAAYNTTNGRVAVMFCAGNRLQEWAYLPFSGKPTQTSHDILVKKCNVVRDRGMSCVAAAERADQGGYKVTDIVQNGTIFMGAAPIMLRDEMVGIVAVTGGDGLKFDQVYADLIASQIEEELEQELQEIQND